MVAPHSMFCTCSRIFSHLRLQVHHIAGDGKIVALGADGIALPVDLLNEEVQLAAHRLVAREHGTQLGKVAAQADGLLVHGDLIGKDGGLGENAAPRRWWCDCSTSCILAVRLRAVLRNGLRRALLHLAGDSARWYRARPRNVRGKLLALVRAHGVVGGKRLIQHGAEIGGRRSPGPPPPWSPSARRESWAMVDAVISLLQRPQASLQLGTAPCSSPAASGRVDLTTASSAAEASTVMNTSTLPRETAFCTRAFTASSAKM